MEYPKEPRKAPFPIIPFAGFALLAAMALSLYIFGFYEATKASFAASVVFILVLAGFVYQVGKEGHELFKIKKYIPTLGKTNIWEFLAVLGASIATYFISKNLGQGGVVASSILGLAGSFVLPRFAVPLFCGSFVGMASPLAYESYTYISIAGSLAGIVFALGKGVFDGFGGKLGTIAFLGCLGTSLLGGIQLQSSPIPSWDVGSLILIYSVSGAVLAYVLSIRFGKGPVTGSAFVGLVAGILLPAVYGAELGKALAVVVFCASFVGMSSAARLGSEVLIALAGLACGLVYIYASPWLGGAGGKLGTLADRKSVV